LINCTRETLLTLFFPFSLLQIPQRISTQNPAEAAVVSALQTMAFSAAPSPEIVVCALQLAMRQPNESLFEASMRVLEVTTRVAHQHNVDLFVLPELSPVGYSEDTFANLLPTTPKLIETYRQIDQAFANQARILQSYICYGTIGRKTRPDGSVGFTIRQIVLDRNGLQVASYDKIHLCDYGKCAETRYFEPGPREPVSFSIDGFRFGLLICADMRNPTLSRSLARDHNVDVLLQPAAFARDVSFRTWKSFRETRAVENSVYFIGVNYAGENFGESSVVPPWVDESHEPHVLGTAEGFLLGRIQRSELNHVRNSMPFYRQLCAERTSK
jgi:predicted amidohydrolase